MSHIHQLISAQCSDGVEFKAIESFVLRPANIRWADQGDTEFQYIDLTSVDRATHAITGASTITSDNAPSRAQQIVREGDVIFGTTRPMLKRCAVITREFDGQICSTGFCVLRPDNNIVLTNFLFHLIGTDDFYAYVEANERGASYPAIPDNVVKKFRVPIPSLEVQREIVKVLDNFTALEAQLETELEARRRQFKYYRDALLALPNAKCFLAGDLFEFKNGLNKGKEFFGKGSPIVNFVDVFKSRSLTEPMIRGRVEVTAKEQGLYSARENDVFFTRTSETREEIGMASVLLADIPCCVFSGFVLRGRPKTTLLLPKFSAYLFSSSDLRKEIIQNSSFTTRALTNGRVLSRLSIPVPPLDEQERIVSILDKFDALVNDVSSGLPAEIKARRQQYQHYRDRLLTFRMTP